MDSSSSASLVISLESLYTGSALAETLQTSKSSRYAILSTRRPCACLRVCTVYTMERRHFIHNRFGSTLLIVLYLDCLTIDVDFEWGCKCHTLHYLGSHLQRERTARRYNTWVPLNKIQYVNLQIAIHVNEASVVVLPMSDMSILYLDAAGACIASCADVIIHCVLLLRPICLPI